MNKFFKPLLLLSAFCPAYPTIPTSSPKLITSTSPGMEDFPYTSKQLSITVRITPDEACTTGSTFPLFSMTLATLGGSAPEYFEVSMLCAATNANIYFRSTWFGSVLAENIFPNGLTPVAFFVTFDLNAKIYKYDLRSDDGRFTFTNSLTITSEITFNANSKFYFCSNKEETTVRACTLSDFKFEYRYYGEALYPAGHLAGTEPEIAAFYPLTGESLATSIGSASSAYFGDKESNPKSGTSPTWDSSNNFVAISAGQFLTVPLPSLSSTILTLSSTFSVAAWVKILANIPSATTTIFAMYSSTGDQVGYKLTVSQSTKQLSLSFGSQIPNRMSTPIPTVTLDQWNLIGFTASLNKIKKYSSGIVFSGTSSGTFEIQGDPKDISPASVIRIGDASDSFNGQVSIVRIMTPGGGIMRSTDLCSSDNSIELGTGSFALACSGSGLLSTADNTCVASCTGKAYEATDTAISLCVACSAHCISCDNTGCLTCETNYLKYKKGCVISCPAKTYSDLTSCIACSDHCTECNAGGCKACDKDYELDTDKKCVLKSSPTTPTTPTTPSTPSKEEAGSSEGGISGGAIAGIVCGSVAIISLAGYAAYSFIAKKFPFASKSTPKNPYLEKKNPPAIEASNPVSPVHTEENPLVP